MELRDIKYFSVVAEHGHLGRAAEALGLSTAALSKSLRRLEKSMQAKLVKRTPKGVDLTTVGAALLSHVGRLQLALDDVEREAADLSHGRAGDLCIGAGPGFAEYLLPAACSALLKDGARVTLKIIVDFHQVLLPALRKGELDLIVSGTLPPSNEALLQEHLYDDEFVVWASAGHRLAKQKRVTIDELAQEHWAFADFVARPWQRLCQVFQEHHLPPPEVTMVSNSVWLRLRTVAASDLLILGSKPLIRQSAARLGLVIIPVKELAWQHSVGVIYRKDAYLSPAARRFIDILKSTARELATAS